MTEFGLFIKNMVAVAEESFSSPFVTTEQKHLYKNQIPQVETRADTPGNRVIIIDHTTGKVKILNKDGDIQLLF